MWAVVVGFGDAVSEFKRCFSLYPLSRLVHRQVGHSNYEATPSGLSHYSFDTSHTAYPDDKYTLMIIPIAAVQDISPTMVVALRAVNIRMRY